MHSSRMRTARSLTVSYRITLQQWRIQDFPDGRESANIFCQKLHQNERNWTESGGGGGTPLDPSMYMEVFILHQLRLTRVFHT